eukprot:6893648-Lingulodinium_polyedra.AAC.1
MADFHRGSQARPRLAHEAQLAQQPLGTPHDWPLGVDEGQQGVKQHAPLGQADPAAVPLAIHHEALDLLAHRVVH